MGKHEDAARSRRGPGDTRATSARRRATLSTFDVTPHKNLACQSWGGRRRDGARQMRRAPGALSAGDHGRVPGAVATALSQNSERCQT
jgi:hypothetical protein